MRLFYFRPIGSGNAYGPIEARDERDARKKAHQTFPRVRMEVWETSRETMAAIQSNYERNYHAMYACE